MELLRGAHLEHGLWNLLLEGRLDALSTILVHAEGLITLAGTRYTTTDKVRLKG